MNPFLKLEVMHLNDCNRRVNSVRNSTIYLMFWGLSYASEGTRLSRAPDCHIAPARRLMLYLLNKEDSIE